MNDRLEAELKKVLARQEPPEDFADRVMQRITSRHQLTFPHWWAIGAAAVLALMLTYVGYRETRIQTLRRSEKQLVFALQLTSRKLSAVSGKLKKASVHVSVQENL
jgi:type VI protein secretion system component VasF